MFQIWGTQNGGHVWSGNYTVTICPEWLVTMGELSIVPWINTHVGRDLLLKRYVFKYIYSWFEPPKQCSWEFLVHVYTVYIYIKQSISTWFSSTDTNIEYVAARFKKRSHAARSGQGGSENDEGRMGLLAQDFQISMVPKMSKKSSLKPWVLGDV